VVKILNCGGWIKSVDRFWMPAAARTNDIDIDLPKPLAGCINQLFTPVGFKDISLYGDCTAATTLDVVNNRLGALLALR